MALTTSQQNFLNMLSAAAIKDWQSNNIVIPSITIAQGILESRWGESQLAREANNLFGIKQGVKWNGPVYNAVTKEQVNGQYITVIAPFRKYNSFLESVNDHSAFLKNNKRYSNLIGVKDFNTVALMLKQDGYATASDYNIKLRRVYDSYNLGQYDIIAFNNGNISSAPVTPQPKPQNKPVGRYIVQSGAYKNEIGANRKLEMVRLKGYPDAFIFEENGLYKVQVGSFNDKANAQRRADELKIKGLDGTVLERNNSTSQGVG